MKFVEITEDLKAKSIVASLSFVSKTAKTMGISQPLTQESRDQLFSECLRLKTQKKTKQEIPVTGENVDEQIFGGMEIISDTNAELDYIRSNLTAVAQQQAVQFWDGIEAYPSMVRGALAAEGQRRKVARAQRQSLGLVELFNDHLTLPADTSSQVLLMGLHG